MAEGRASDTPIPSTEINQDESTVTDDQWKAMQDVLSTVYGYRTDDGHDPSKIFARMVNKRAVPDYYTIIQEPMALSTIKSNINTRKYMTFSEFVRDFALISHNAQVYNRPDSGAYQDALEIKQLLEKEFAKLAVKKVVSNEGARLPFLGDIPPQEELPPEEAPVDDEDEEEEEDDDEEDEPDDSDDEGVKRRKKRGPRSTAAITKREPGGKNEDKEAVDVDARKRRGRPPRVDTPLEARIKAIMKGMRKPRNSSNGLMISHFERLPDKAQFPDYYVDIKQPMAMDQIKKKLKRKKYNSVDQFMKDVEIMFENAKSYNQDESQIYKDAVHLQIESRTVADEEKKKPDTEYVMEEGRLPMPNGILHNGELWKVGDWVHITNANDLTKPIVAQIYRTWQDVEGNKWVNACWYYRPEQTIHRFDRHFFENEVVKTGQYRDHPIDEVVDRCFVMFFTRYNKGRPRNFPSDKEIYVCEARYNEEKHKLNKIKTWASCLPDEVRDKDYEMDLFAAPKKIKKIPSPIAYLLKDEQKETDDLPKPVWGADNAPPKIGAVHRRPRDAKESPPPEPTPTPPPEPPPPPPPPPRQISNISSHATNGYGNMDHRTDYSMRPAPTPQPHHHQSQTSFTPSHPSQYQPHSASPAPLQQMVTPQPSPFPAPLTPHQNFTAAPAAAHPNQYTAPHAPHSYPPAANPPVPGRAAPTSASLGYKAPQPVEVYCLNEVANASIPEDIRRQFHCDDQGRVLFFTAPPLDPVAPAKDGQALGHSARYLAAKAKRDAMLYEKRKRVDGREAADADARKKAKPEEQNQTEDKVVRQVQGMLGRIEDGLARASKQEYQTLFHGDWRKGVDVELDKLQRKQAEAAEKGRRADESFRKLRERETVPVTGMTAFLDG